MKTECTQDRVEFAGRGCRRDLADRAGGHVSSDCGILFLCEVDLQTGLMEQFAGCFIDRRSPKQIEHSVLVFFAKGLTASGRAMRISMSTIFYELIPSSRRLWVGRIRPGSIVLASWIVERLWPVSQHPESIGTNA